MKTFINWLPINNGVVGVGYGNNIGKEKCSEVSEERIKFLDGFVISPTAFETILSFNSMHLRLYDIMQQLDKRDYCNLNYIGNLARKLFEKALIPYKLRFAIEQAYNRLQVESNNLTVTIKSCLIYEDEPQTKFEDTSKTYSNLNSEPILMEAIKKAFASVYSDTAIKYREEKNIPHHKMSVTIKIQKVINPEIQCFIQDQSFKINHIVKVNIRESNMQTIPSLIF